MSYLTPAQRYRRHQYRLHREKRLAARRAYWERKNCLPRLRQEAFCAMYDDDTGHAMYRAWAEYQTALRLV